MKIICIPNKGSLSRGINEIQPKLKDKLLWDHPITTIPIPIACERFSRAGSMTGVPPHDIIESLYFTYSLYSVPPLEDNAKQEQIDSPSPSLGEINSQEISCIE